MSGHQHQDARLGGGLLYFLGGSSNCVGEGGGVLYETLKIHYLGNTLQLFTNTLITL